MSRACSTHGKKKNPYKFLVGMPEGKPRRWWEDNDKMDLRDT
jgi:hypothetical protein